MLCLDDPECVFCNRGSELGMSSCVHRSRSEVSMLWEELQVTVVISLQWGFFVLVV